MQINSDIVQKVTKLNLTSYIDELKNINKDNIGSWPTWIYVLFAVGLSLVILFGSYYYVVESGQQSVSRAEQKIHHLKKEFRKKHEHVAHLPQYKKQLTHLKKTLKGLVAELPSKTEVPHLLRRVSQTRAANGLSEDKFKPLVPKKNQFYVTLPNHLVVRGQFKNLAHFVSDVAQLSRIVTIDNVSIKPTKKHAKQLKMNATLKTYRYIGKNTSHGNS